MFCPHWWEASSFMAWFLENTVTKALVRISTCGYSISYTIQGPCHVLLDVTYPCFSSCLAILWWFVMATLSLFRPCQVDCFYYKKKLSCFIQFSVSSVFQFSKLSSVGFVVLACSSVVIVCSLSFQFVRVVALGSSMPGCFRFAGFGNGSWIVPCHDNLISVVFVFDKVLVFLASLYMNCTL